jgi:methyl-accepting chemotaxis protein
MIRKVISSFRNFNIKKKVITGTVIVLFFSWFATNTLYLSRHAQDFNLAMVTKARSICIMGEAMREYMSDNWGRNIYDKASLLEDVKGKFVYTVPVFSSIATMAKKAETLGYIFRVPKISPRNPKNAPDPEELKVLQRLKSQNLDEYSYFDYDREEIRYFRAIKLTKDCLICHGDPATSYALWGRKNGTDPTGMRMEGWKVGEIHGAFEVIMPVREFFSQRRWIIVKMLLINIFIILISVVIIRLVVKKGLDPLDSIKKSLDEINKGAGDLTKKIDILRRDEVGEVAALFNSFIDQLRSMVLSIKESAHHVSSSSLEMTNSSQNLANVAQDQAASIEETSSGMEQIKATIDSVSDNAKNQASKADSTRSSMEYLATSINNINQNAQDANHMADETHNYAKEGEQVLVSTVDSMREISSSSNKITEIVTIITDISDQINLLSLNASIEAARAGDHGRGFAVVAEEISKLADQTAQSSKEINKLILETNNKVDAGSRLVERTAESLRKIIDNVKNTASLMENIAKSTVDLNGMGQRVTEEVLQVNKMSEEISIMMEEQSLSSNEIISAIEQINNVTQSVASGSEELAAASEELSSQSEVMMDIVRRFKVDE